MGRGGGWGLKNVLKFLFYYDWGLVSIENLIFLKEND